MRYGVGIDTGGTYTDAVIYEMEGRKVVASNKAQTTRDDLTVGILNALDGLDLELVRQAEVICLSTTLATNACVEDRGARSKLLFIGVDAKAVAWAGKEAGLDDPELICYAPEGMSAAEDWKAFLEEKAGWLEDAQALGIVELNADRTQSAYEKAARAAIKEKYDIPVICGYELSNEINSIKRGASALLNGRLIPVLAEFLEAIHGAMAERNISAPIAIMRSDGTLMSEKFTGEHPVETILCGPAASVVGSSALLDEENAVIVDMGGTTTDIALVRDGAPVKVNRGIRVGRWHTAVRGLMVHTLGLGGDSAVRYQRKNKQLYVDSVRVMPLCAAAVRWPQIIEYLKTLQEDFRKHSLPLHEFFYLVREIGQDSHYSDSEKRFCAALQKGPLAYEEAAKAMGVEPYSLYLYTDRLEKEGVIMRCGLTSTDIMHLKGDFNVFSREAAYLGADFVAKSVGKTVEELGDWVYNEVKKKLYFYIAEMLLYEERPELKKTGLDAQTAALLEWAWELAKKNMDQPEIGGALQGQPGGAGVDEQGQPEAGSAAVRGQSAGGHIGLSFGTRFHLIGVGAPIHIFLPDVAKALGTACVIPKEANVVNAVGAVACNITASHTVEIWPDDGGFVVHDENGSSVIKELEVAIEYVWPLAEKKAREDAISRGAAEPLTVRRNVKPITAVTGYGGEIFMRCEVTAIAMGVLKLAEAK